MSQEQMDASDACSTRRRRSSPSSGHGRSGRGKKELEMRRMSLYIVGDAGACKQVERCDSASRVQFLPPLVYACLYPTCPPSSSDNSACRGPALFRPPYSVGGLLVDTLAGEM